MTTALASIALVLSALALVAGILALRTLGRLRRSIAVLNRGADQRESLLEASGRHAAASVALAARHDEVATSVAQLHDHVDATSAALRAELANTVHRLTEETSRGLRRVALVRYDAFEDLAGRMSFSLALLDDHGDGVTISAIVGQHDTRVYAKGISGGVSRGRLGLGKATRTGTPTDDRQPDGGLQLDGDVRLDGDAARSSSGRDPGTGLSVALTPEEQQAVSAALSPSHAAPYPAAS